MVNHIHVAHHRPNIMCLFAPTFVLCPCESRMCKQKDFGLWSVAPGKKLHFVDVRSVDDTYSEACDRRKMALGLDAKGDVDCLDYVIDRTLKPKVLDVMPKICDPCQRCK